MPEGAAPKLGHHIAHPLLRARDWQARPEFGQVCDWWRAGGAGVCALVGIGGAGKTAIAQRFLLNLPGVMAGSGDEGVDLPEPEACFVFSFYDAPNPDAFFRELAAWLQGWPEKKDDERVPSYEQTKRLLAAAPRCLLVLDGFEKSQDEGGRSGRFGHILDGRLRDLVLRAAEGYLPRVSILITTRFRLFDTAAQRSPIYTPIPVEKLAEDTAIALLRERGVRGTDDRLRALARDQGLHALSVDLMGGYIARFYEGDPDLIPADPHVEIAVDAGPVLDPETAAIQEQERKFARIAARYGEALRESDPAALDLLQRFCLFRLGVTADILADVFTGDQKEEVASPDLAGLSRGELNVKLNRLVEMHLLEAEPSEGQPTTYTIHPAVRGGFLRGLDDETAQRGHIAARDGLTTSLGGLPGNGSNPSDPKTLDLLEEIMYHTLAAGYAQEAWDIYCLRMGGGKNLVWRQGAYERGERICRVFADGTPCNAPLPLGLTPRHQSKLLGDWALSLAPLGRLTDAVHCLVRAGKIDMGSEDWANASADNQNLAETRLAVGCLAEALAAAEDALRLAEVTDNSPSRCCTYGYRGYIRALCGETDSGLKDFGHALHWQHDSEMSDKSLYSMRGIQHALLLARMDRLKEATDITEANKLILREIAGADNYHEPPCNLILSDIAREQGDLNQARILLAQAREWAIARDAKEVLCWATLVHAKIELTEAGYQTDGNDETYDDNTGNGSAADCESTTGPNALLLAREAIEEGLRIARDCGYGIYHIDLLLLRAQVALHEGDSVAALNDIFVALDDGVPAHEATGRPELIAAEDPECGYAWGIALGYHLRAEALLLRAAQALGQSDCAPARFAEKSEAFRKDVEAAREVLAKCIDLRERIQDPKVKDTKRVLSDLDGGILTYYPLATTKRGEGMKDFFISYNGADKAWAEWIAWTLEEAGYSVVIQAWDFRPGNNFVLQMDKGAQDTEKTVVVLSDNYLNALYTQSEWAAAFVDDPTGQKRKLIPFRVAECKAEGLLKPVVYVDLVDLAEADARMAVLGAFSERGKPAKAPNYPGAPVERSTPDRQEFPGAATAPSRSGALDSTVEQVAARRGEPQYLAPEDRLILVQKLNATTPQQFNMLLFSLNPPAGLIPSMPAPQADRSVGLLGWAESPGGPGLPAVVKIFEAVLNPQ